VTWPSRWTGRTSGASLAKQDGADMVIVGGVGLEDPAQVALAQDHDVIQALPTDRADQPLRMPILLE
jgi:hypothetical protein